MGILHEVIFGHVAWIFTHVEIVLIVIATNILITNQHLFDLSQGESNMRISRNNKIRLLPIWSGNPK